MNKTTLLIGASPKKERYSNIAMNLLKDKGYKVIPLNPAFDEIDGIKVIRSLDQIITKNKPVHTVTLYINPKRLEAMVDKIISLKPDRVIFNPGTESDEIKKQFSKHGIETLEACTIVMLNTGQY